MFLGYSKDFWWICLSLLLFMISFNVILPEMNDYLADLGGSDYKGLIITLFTITAALGRPFSGKLSDTIGRKKVMYIGIFIGTTALLMYPAFPLVLSFLALRLFHGLGNGFLPTGATALVTDVLPVEKRATGMGIWGVFTSVGFGVGQPLGSIIHKHYNYDVLFWVGAVSCILAGILIVPIKETLPVTQKFKFSLLKVNMSDIFSKEVLPAAIVMFLTTISTGVIFVLVPEICEFINIENKGYFFALYVSSTIFIRLFASKLSDKIGRRETLIIGTIFQILSLVLLAFADNFTMFTFSGIIFGISTGINSPTIFAWNADLSHSTRRGVGAGTLFIALEVGIMLGSFGTLFLYNNTFDSILWTFIPSIFFLILGLVYLIWHLKYKHSET